MNPHEFYNEVKQVGRSWWVFLILGILAFAVGIWMLFDQVIAAVFTSYCFAAYFLLSGIFDFVTVLLHKEDIPAWGWSIALSVIVFGFGVALFCTPLLSAGVIAYLFAFAIIALGIRFISMFAVMDRTASKVLVILMGILVAASGVMCIFNPLAGIMTVTMIEALSMIFAGIGSLIAAYELSVLHSKCTKFEKKLKSQ